ncbi:hypothetical protein K1719_018539 [Acacia pycnantha]|nr:hypothetical protein K1719_018539 [Acacia pycnantha]
MEKVLEELKMEIQKGFQSFRLPALSARAAKSTPTKPGVGQMSPLELDCELLQPAGSSESSYARPAYILVIRATNRLDAVDTALRRLGRFNREIFLGIPDEYAREEILVTRRDGYACQPNVKFRGSSQIGSSFNKRREGFSSIPNVKWEDIGGLDLLRQEFEDYIVRRIKYLDDCKEFGVNLEAGFLLYGPPGCGKTLIAKAVANEAGANFIHIQGPELLNKYVGESELAVRTLFSRARTCSPCIIFFDEVDALTTKRGKEGGWIVERLLDQLLVELDGAEQREGVFVIGATNRPEVMDRALLRPGRLGKLLYVPLPSSDERGLILKALARKKPIDDSVDLCALGKMEACENLSGADLAALMDQAALAAAKEKWASKERTWDALTIKFSHFETALTKISASQKQYYQRLSETFKAAA